MTDSLDQALSERFALQHDELPMPDFADVLRRASRISIRPEPRKRPRDYRLWGARPVLAAAIVVGVLAGAGVGIAAGVGAFEGTPAPPDVSTNFTQLNKMADAAIQQGISATLPQVDASKAHGVIEIQTPDGPQDLWAAPNDQGGQCYFIDWANDPPMQDGSKYGFGGGCGPSPPPPASSPPPASPISFGDVWVAGHPDLMTVWGTVHVDAATVQITLDDGSTVTLPVAEHAFLGSLSKGTKLVKVAAFDAAGNQVAERTLRR